MTFLVLLSVCFSSHLEAVLMRVMILSCTNTEKLKI